jgi:hypothetical protein
LWASKVISHEKGLAKAKPFKKTNYFVSHRIYSWQVAPQQSLLPLGSGIIKLVKSQSV